MQTTIVAAGKPAGIMPGAAAEADAAAIEGAGFAALLMAQIQGQGDAGLALPLAAAEGGADLTLPADDVSRDPGNGVSRGQPVGLGLDPALLGVAAVAAFPLPPQAVAPDPVNGLMNRPSVSLSPTIRLEDGDRSVSIPSLDADAVAVDEKRAIAFSGVTDLPRHNSSLPVQARAAEFAVDGKPLPSEIGVKAVDGGVKSPSLEALHQPGSTLEDVPAVAPKSFSPDGFRLPDSTPSVVPVMQPPHQVSAVVDAGGGTMVAVPVGNAGWDDALGQKVVWMAGQQQQVAELHLNPPHLGPVEVHLSVSNDQVSALFVSHQPAVREAIEAAMPRLREILADSGMMLGNATVTSDSLPRQQHPSGGEGQPGMISRPDSTFLDSAPAPLARGMLSLHNEGRGMVDFFA